MKIDSSFTCVELIAFKQWGCLITCRGIVVVVGFWQLLKLCKCLVLLWQQQQFSFNLLLKAVACDVAITPSKGDNLLIPLVNSFNAMMRWFYRLNECHSTPSAINYELFLQSQCCFRYCDTCAMWFKLTNESTTLKVLEPIVTFGGITPMYSAWPLYEINQGV